MSIEHENIKEAAQHEKTTAFEEWEVKPSHENKNGQVFITFTKVKMLRPRVMLLPFEAKNANSGFMHASNESCTLYLLPGQTNVFKSQEIVYNQINN